MIFADLSDVAWAAPISFLVGLGLGLLVSSHFLLVFVTRRKWNGRRKEGDQ